MYEAVFPAKPVMRKKTPLTDALSANYNLKTLLDEQKFVPGCFEKSMFLRCPT